MTVSHALIHKTKTKVSKIEAVKEIIRAWRLDPDKILTREALTEPHRTIINGSQDRENSQLEIVSRALKDLARHETTGQMHSKGGGPAGN